MKTKGVVVAPEPLAVEIGARILEQGGSAFDAAIATSVAQGVTNPFLCGLGGRGGFFCRTVGGEPFVIDCGGSIGSGERPKSWSKGPAFRPEPLAGYRIDGPDGLRGYREIITPGYVKGIWDVYNRFASGRFSWSALLQPSIQLCMEGFKVYPYIAQRWEEKSQPGIFGLLEKFNTFPEFRKRYTKDGEAYVTGDILVQTDYGRTLERIAKEGGDVFYLGDIGDIIARDYVENGSFVTREDLRGYACYDDTSLYGEYKDYKVITGSRAGSHEILMFNILKHFDVSSLGHNSPAYVELLSKIMLAGFSDTFAVAGDPPYSIQKMVEGQAIRQERADWWASRIKSGLEKKDLVAPFNSIDDGTTSVVIVDEAGNVAAWTHSLGGVAGSGAVTPELGFLHNNFLRHFNPMPNEWNSMVPGKRCKGGAQTMLFYDGRPFMVLGSAGGSRQNTAVFQVMVNVVEFGMTVDEAVKAPRIHAEQPGILLVEPGFPAEAVDYMRGLGYKINDSATLARVAAALVDPVTGQMHGGVDPRGGAVSVVK